MNHDTITDERFRVTRGRTSHAMGLTLLGAGLAFAVSALASARGAPSAEVSSPLRCERSALAVSRPPPRNAPDTRTDDTPERRAERAIDRASAGVTRCVQDAGGSLAATLYFDRARGSVTRTTLTRAHGAPLPVPLLRCAREALARVHLAPDPAAVGTTRVRHEWRAPRLRRTMERDTPF